MHNEEVPKEILTSLSNLTNFLSKGSSAKNNLKESNAVKKMFLYNEFRFKFLNSTSKSTPKTNSAPTSVYDEHVFEKDYYEEEEEDSESDFDFNSNDYRNENKFNFKSQKVQPPLEKISQVKRPTSTQPSLTIDTTTVFVDTPFRLELDPVSGLFSTVKNR